MNEKVAVPIALVLAIAGGMLAAKVIERPAKDKPNIEFLYDMAHSHAAETQRVWDARDAEGRRILTAGITQLEPQEGTMFRRGQNATPAINLIYPYITDDSGKFVLPGDKDSRYNLAATWAMPSYANAELGKKFFNRTCAPCHGVDGLGDTPITNPVKYIDSEGNEATRGRYMRPPSLVPTQAERRANAGQNPPKMDATTFTDGQIFLFISEGRNFPNMPPYERVLTPEERWHIVAYIREMQRASAK